MPEQRYNQIRVVLAQKNRTAKQLAEHLQVSHNTVSRWCTNTSQPNVHTLHRIARYLGVPPGDLLTDPSYD